MQTKKLSLDVVLNIGKVISVKGRTVDVLVSKTKNASILLYEGKIIKNVSVGGYIKIGKGFTELVGKIDGEYITEDNNILNKPYKHEKEKINRVLNISLLGYFENSEFKQGLKELPLIDNECFLLTQEELDAVHNFIKRINGIPDIKLKIGRLARESGKDIEIGINSLFASHIGIFGNTGSGKSYTLAGIYYRLFQRFQGQQKFKQNAKFLLVDFNGEFSETMCITKEKRVYNLSTRKNIEDIKETDRIPLSENILLDIELLSILSNATDKTQKPYVSRMVKLFKKVHIQNQPEEYFKGILRNKAKDILRMSIKDKASSLIDYLASILMDGNISSSVTDELINTIEWNNTNKHFMPKGGISRGLSDSEIENTPLYQMIENYSFPKNKIKKIIHFFYLQLIFDLYNDKALYEHIGPAINKLKSKTGDLEKVFDFENQANNFFSDSNFIVLNLNDSNIDIKKIVPLILCRQIYSEHKIINRQNPGKYLNIVIDEAHNILSYTSERESSTWKDYRLETFEEIIKEGRKFGVFLTLASQRPSDISDTIISQLHNYFLHRLINNKDIQSIERTISYLDRVSFESLPILPTGTCIFAGLSAHVPVIIEIDEITDKSAEPMNKTIKPTDFWVD